MNIVDKYLVVMDMVQMYPVVEVDMIDKNLVAVNNMYLDLDSFYLWL
jgi:hypothetical protein